jgi:hypothetical protein
MFKGTAPYYARYRPGYPPELLVRLAATARLDGTGRACSTSAEEPGKAMRERLKPSYRERTPVDALLGRRR